MIDKIVAVDIYWTWTFLIAIGVICLLIGYEVIKTTPKPPLSEEEYTKKYRSKMKWIGPIIILFGILKAFRII